MVWDYNPSWQACKQGSDLSLSREEQSLKNKKYSKSCQQKDFDDCVCVCVYLLTLSKLKVLSYNAFLVVNLLY